jgi:hypothetical protein
MIKKNNRVQRSVCIYIYIYFIEAFEQDKSRRVFYKQDLHFDINTRLPRTR